MANPIRQLLERVVLPLARRLLSSRAKRYLKRFWDPMQRLSARERFVVRSERSRAPAHEGRIPDPEAFDIVCFGVFDWDFRFQRPQQLMTQLAQMGHRVFYLTLQQSSSRSIEVTSVAPLVWEVRLPHSEPLDRYAGGWSRAVASHLSDAIERFRCEHSIHAAVALVQLATWAGVAIDTSERFGWTLVYDCMDDWSAMPRVTSATRDDEERLGDAARGIVVSSATLAARWRRHPFVSIVRNGADFERFHSAKEAGLLAGVPRPIAGYFGALAEWFDVDLVAEVATRRPDVSFIFFGHAAPEVARRLAGITNVTLLGEKPYALMPSYLAEFDVCTIPFRIDEVTSATDPVKLYEYFSRGCPVVATPMRELERHRDLLYLAGGAEAFAHAIDQALGERDARLTEARVALARQSTWAARAREMEAAMRAASPLVSIIVVTWNNLELTKLCLDSLMANTHDPRFEVIVVDNASSDGTRELLTSRAAADGRIRVLLNDENAGFARANNQGIAAAKGDVFILLNNDTVVPPQWSSRLFRHARRPDTGLVVAVTNFSGNESRIDVPYTSLDAMERFAAERARARDGEAFDIAVAAMYCVAMRRDVFEHVGLLDERFAIGMFEDDDYSHRVRRAGYRVVCAEDAFVHHFGEASFKTLPQATYFELFERNRKLYEEKWGVAWVPHRGKRDSGNSG